MFLENRKAIDSLEVDLKNKSFSHAYLFCGTKGIGKFSHAKNFARAILKEDSEDLRFFNGIDEYEDTDLLVVKSKDSIKKQEIEEIIEDSFSKPYSGNYKVVIIDDFDKVTVISRCRVLKFSDISENRIEKFLISKNISEKNAKLFSRLSNGNVSLALKYSEDPELLSKREEIIRALDEIIRRSEFIFDEMNFFKENKDDFRDILNFMLIWYLDLIYLKSGREDNIVNVDKLDLLKLQDVNIQRALKSYDAIINAIKRSENNINFDLNIENLLMELGE